VRDPDFEQLVPTRVPNAGTKRFEARVLRTAEARVSLLVPAGINLRAERNQGHAIGRLRAIRIDRKDRDVVRWSTVSIGLGVLRIGSDVGTAVPAVSCPSVPNETAGRRPQGGVPFDVDPVMQWFAVNTAKGEIRIPLQYPKLGLLISTIDDA
jgi:hypothetical protein